MKLLSTALLISCLCGVIYLWGWSACEKQANAELTESKILKSLPECHNGDLVFRRTESFTSRVVLACDPEAVFSHVGMVYKTHNQVFVIHAVPGGHSSRNKQPLKCEPLESFLKDDLAIDYRICHIRPEHQMAANAAAEHAYTFFARGYLFDHDFDLATEQALYCTELVWKAYRKAGLELLGEADFSLAPFSKTPIIYPSAFVECQYFTSIP
jgi:hypothetical protein